MDDYSEEYGPADLGDVTMGKLIDKHEKTPHSKGLAALLKLGPKEDYTPKIKATKKIETITTEVQNFDPMVMNEILRVVREKNHTMEQRFDLIEAQIRSIGHSTRFHFDKKLFGSLMAICLLVGILIGREFNQEPIPVTTQVAKEIAPAAISAKKVMITKKFINLRADHSPKASKILTIAPAQEVEVLSSKGGWAKVKYANKLTGQEYTGYLWDEYLGVVKE